MSWRDPIAQARRALNIWPAAVGTVPDGLLRYQIVTPQGGSVLIDARQHEPYLMPIFQSDEYFTQVFFCGAWWDWHENTSFLVSWVEPANANLRNLLVSDALKALFAQLIVPQPTNYCPVPCPLSTVPCPRCPDGPATGTDSRDPIAAGGDPCPTCGGSAWVLRTSYPVDFITEKEAMETEKLFNLANIPENQAIRDLAKECRALAATADQVTPVIEATQKITILWSTDGLVHAFTCGCTDAVVDYGAEAVEADRVTLLPRMLTEAERDAVMGLDSTAVLEVLGCGMTFDNDTDLWKVLKAGVALSQADARKQATVDLPQHLLGDDYTPEVAAKVEQALMAGQTSTGVDLPLTPEIDTAITEALKPRQATISNMITAMVTDDEIAEEFNDKFDCYEEIGGWPDRVYAEATEHFRGRRVVSTSKLGDHAAGTVFHIEEIRPSSTSAVSLGRGQPVVALRKGDEVLGFVIPAPTQVPVPLSAFLGCVNAIHHLDDIDVVIGTDVRIPYAVKLANGNIVEAGSIAVCKYIKIGVDKASDPTTITFEAPFGSFDHLTLHPESPTALSGHQTRKHPMIKFSKSEIRAIVKDYVGGKGLYAIGSNLGVSAATVKRVLANSGVTVRAQGRPINVANAYTSGQGLGTIGTISAKTGIPVKRLRQNLASKGVKIRGVGRPSKNA